MRTFGEVAMDTGEGALRGGLWGALAGVACLAGAAFTGGATLAMIPALVGPAVGAAAVGAKAGAGIGAIMGATGHKDKIDDVGQAAIQEFAKP
ncbi:MAG: hypothetical protein IJP86_02425 [Synergistaceae bacterium]|nr:hypothetical protein [Synergistaceae bacterium]